MKYLSLFLLSAFLLYLVIISTVPLLDWFILFPTTAPVPSSTAVRRTIPFEHGQLEIWTVPPRSASGLPDLYLLSFYGNGSRAEYAVQADAEIFCSKPVELWGVNYPGYGGSTAPARLARIGPAALAAFDALKMIAQGRPIIVSGFSLGTAAALYVAAHRTVAGVILQDPPAIRQMILGQHGWWNLFLLAGPLSLRLPSALDSLNNAKTVRAPGVFLLSEKDRVVLPKYQALILNAYAGKKLAIPLPGADHNSVISGTALKRLQGSIDWVLEQASF
ncbi:MAG: alpha/beta hydrolase [Verrucomicrobia bacterium]|nr:alpha/beta hydrolase [Verrucomicrobiota bacterium]